MQVKSKRGPSANLSELPPGDSFKLDGAYWIKTKSSGKRGTPDSPTQTFTCVNLRTGELAHLPDTIVELAPGHFQLT